MGKKIEFEKIVTLPKGELIFIRDSCFQLLEDTQVLGSDEALFRALSKGNEQNIYTKNSLNSKFSAVDDWDESPLVLEGELKLRVMQALYAGESEAVYSWAGKKETPTCTSTAKAYISPVIRELEEIRDAKA
ncbi:hypothetical protein [Acinetobacter radioresistens]|uniref:hypothetical protein n=1 Tax=Acinetobacter radioresistens TaxID=40216 RepID=UPI0021CD6F4C|nr:hypothetical protein [Acinetobacter radioresistens]MCU4517832.1 hypothetical protein [Acinetobacter radioresistens]